MFLSDNFLEKTCRDECHSFFMWIFRRALANPLFEIYAVIIKL